MHGTQPSPFLVGPSDALLCVEFPVRMPPSPRCLGCTRGSSGSVELTETPVFYLRVGFSDQQVTLQAGLAVRTGLCCAPLQFSGM